MTQPWGIPAITQNLSEFGNVTENLGMPKFGSLIGTSVSLSMDIIYTGINSKILASIFHGLSRFFTEELVKEPFGLGVVVHTFNSSLERQNQA